MRTTINLHAKQLGYSDKEIERFVYKYGYRKSTRLNQEIKTLLNTMYRIERKQFFVIIPSKMNYIK